MKKILVALVTIVTMLSLVACGGSGNNSADAPNDGVSAAEKQENVSTDTPVQIPEENKRTQKNGFDSATNGTYKLAGYSIEIPSYWECKSESADSIQLFAETGDKAAMLQISAQAENDDSYPVNFDGLMADNDNLIAAFESTVFKKMTDYEVVDSGVIKGILYKGSVDDEGSGLTGYSEVFVFASEEDRAWCTMILLQTDNTEYLYTDDFMKVIQSISKQEDADGLRPEFKGAMDTYEAFYDEYCEIMKKFAANPSNAALLAEYMDMVTKALEVDEAFKAWDEKDLSNEELKYYLEVNNRVMQKMIDVAG